MIDVLKLMYPNASLTESLAIDSARKKILLQLGYPSNQIFIGSINEREMLLTLKGRYALVMTNTEGYLMKTAEDITVKSSGF